ncbi:MAG: hypothetical protein AAFV53_07480, partial [Myxococcota bacterium]
LSALDAVRAGRASVDEVPPSLDHVWLVSPRSVQTTPTFRRSARSCSRIDGNTADGSPQAQASLALP